MKNNRAVFGLILVSAGILWLLRSLGILDVSLLFSFLRLWPLLFIAIGVSIIFSRNLFVKAVTWILFFAALVLYGIFGMPAGQINRGGGDYKEYVRSADLPRGTAQGIIRLETGAADLKVGLTDRYLYDARITDRGIIFEDGGNETAEVRIYSSLGSGPAAGPGGRNSWDVKLSSKIPWEVRIAAGAVDGDLDFSDVMLKKLDIAAGASDIKIRMPENAGHTEVMIRAGVSSIRIEAAEGTGLKIRSKSVLASNNFTKAGLVRESGSYYTTNYETAGSRIDITIDIALGEAELKFD